MREAWISGLLRLTVAERERVVAALTVGQQLQLARDWAAFAHGGQRSPDGDWRTWVMMAGRGFGKTLAGAQWVLEQVRAANQDGYAGGPLRVALVAATMDEARRIMVEGKSGLLSIGGKWIEAWEPSRRSLRIAGGAEATLFSGASPEALRGPEHHFAWCDELAKWEKAGECWDMLQLGLRLGVAPRVLVTTTPRPGPVLKGIMAEPGCVVTGGRTHTNPHLPDAFKARIDALYAGTRLGRQEVEGELLGEIEGALWREGVFEAAMALGGRLAGAVRLVRVVIGVDPPSGDGTCGIVACGRDAEGIAYLLGDHSVTAASPEGWARAVAEAAALHGAGGVPVLVVAETNQGGHMVEAVLRGAGAGLRVKAVTARTGKAARAEPVAHLFEQGKVAMARRWPALEAELRGLAAGGGYQGPGRSPDRADAMVWAMSDLMLAAERVPGIRLL